ncbi:hypothetical protein LDENG_00013130 [Lucifuga dentata]|nr:hypothetical protein LDENG_00013130 [Lucifuga dentata]
MAGQSSEEQAALMAGQSSRKQALAGQMADQSSSLVKSLNIEVQELSTSQDIWQRWITRAGRANSRDQRCGCGSCFRR